MSKDIQKLALNAMMAVNAAMRNLHLYPITSTSTQNAIQKALESIETVFEIQDTLDFSESERSIIICGQPLGEKHQKTPHVSSFLELMLGLHIKDIIFMKGLEPDELVTVFEILSRKPEEIEEAGGVEAVFSEKKIKNVRVELKKTGEGHGDIGIEFLFSVVAVLDEMIDDQLKEAIAGRIADYLVDQEDMLIRVILLENLKGKMGDALFFAIIERMDHDRFETTSNRLKEMRNSSNPDDAEAAAKAFKKLTGSQKWQTFMEETRIREEKERAERERLQKHLRKGLESLLKGQKDYLGDHEVMSSLPDTVEGYIEEENIDSVRAVLNALREGILDENPDARKESSRIAAELMGKIENDAFGEIFDDIVKRTETLWEMETIRTEGLEKLSTFMASRIGEKLVKKEFDDCLPILKRLNDVQLLKGDEHAEFRELAVSVISRIAGSDIVKRMVEIFRNNEGGKREKTAEMLALLGSESAGALIDVMKTSDDPSEISRITQILTDMGPSALPALIEATQGGGSPEFLKGVVSLLGKLGGADSVDHLVPLLSSEHYPVQKEVVANIFNIGGDRRGEIFLEALEKADDRLKCDIVRMIGALGLENAIPSLLPLFENKSKFRNELAEQVCTALGKIGSLEAIPALSEVVSQEKKGFLGAKPFDARVKAAARSALARISSAKNSQEKPAEKTGMNEKKGGESRRCPEDWVEKWKELCDPLSVEERAILFENLVPEEFEEGWEVYHQADPGETLYFVEKGELLSSFEKNGKQIPFGSMGEGSVFGGDGFFDNSVRTSTVIAKTAALLHSLEKDVMKDITGEFPDIVTRLRSYEKKRNGLFEALKKKGKDRRTYPRIQLAGIVGTKLPEGIGGLSGKTLKGDLVNISGGGLCFQVKNVQESSEGLLFQPMRMKSAIRIKNNQHKFDFSGTVVAARSLKENLLAIHVKFDDIMSQFIPKRK